MHKHLSVKDIVEAVNERNPEKKKKRLVHIKCEACGCSLCDYVLANFPGVLSREQKIARRIIIARNNRFPNNSISCFHFQCLMLDVLFDLYLAAKKSQLSDAWYDHFEKTSYSEILVEVGRATRDLWMQNKSKYGVDLGAHHLFGRDYEKNRILKSNVSMLTRDLVLEIYGIFHQQDKIYMQNVLYAKFLRDNDMGNRKEASITEKDITPDESTGVYARRNILLNK